MSASDEVATAVAARHAPPPRPVFRLEVTRGPEAGQGCLIDGSLPGSLLVGQSAVCDFRLSDPHVSRRHATFDLSGSELLLADLGSTNGTRVNGVAIRASAVGSSAPDARPRASVRDDSPGDAPAERLSIHHPDARPIVPPDAAWKPHPSGAPELLGGRYERIRTRARHRVAPST